MKKFLAIVLAFVLLLPLPACKKEQKPLRILLDIAYSPDTIAATEDRLELLLYELKELGGPELEDVEIESLPLDTAERSAALTRIRTEVMAGQGPDLYIVGYQSLYDSRRETAENDSLFLMPEKSMALGLFYPLDDFIENAQFMEWENLNQTVMQAGHSEEWGQVILPLEFDFHVACYLKSDVNESPAGATWEDSLHGDEILQSAAANGNAYEPDLLADSFGALADYQNHQLLFTEEELAQRIEEIIAQDEKQEAGGFDDLPPHFIAPDMGIGFEGWNYKGYDETTGKSSYYIPELSGDFHSDNLHNALGQEVSVDPVPVTLVPVYSDDGGITATVETFAAINANSKRAKDAFMILDYLCSRESQMNSPLYNSIVAGYLYPDDEVLQVETPAYNGGGSYWAFSDENFAEYKALREQISHVKFYGTLDLELRELYLKCKTLSPDARAEEIHTTYTRMKRELSE